MTCSPDFCAIDICLSLNKYNNLEKLALSMPRLNLSVLTFKENCKLLLDLSRFYIMQIQTDI